MINNELIEKLLSILQSKQYGAVKSLVQDMNEVDVAEAIEEIFEENEEPETLLRLFRLLPKERSEKADAGFKPGKQKAYKRIFKVSGGFGRKPDDE